MSILRDRRLFLIVLSLLLILGASIIQAQDNPDGFPVPDLVVIPGTLQDELGCPGEWQPDCESTALKLDEASGLWTATFLVPAGTYEYKVAFDGSWDRNYGLNGEPGGPNIPLTVEADTDVTFTYDHARGMVYDSVNGEAPAAQPAAPAVPSIVNIPGTIQPALGCPGEWAPDCEATFLAYNEAYNIFERSFEVPAGSYEYKVAVNGSWSENYGGFADRDGPNIALSVPETTTVTFLYDHDNKWIMDDIRHQIVTAPGSYQDELGCSGEWQPECMITWLQDIDGDGIYTFTTSDIPAGDYETKVTIGRSWDVNYGANGESDGANIAFSVPQDGETITFTYDSSITTMVVNVGGSAVSGANLRERRAHWVLRDTIAWNIEPQDNLTYKLLYSPNADIRISVFGLAGEYETLDLSLHADGLPESVVAKFPHLADYAAFTLAEEATARVPELLTGQVAIAAYRGDSIVDLAGLQIPGVLDDLYTYSGSLGLTFADDNTPTITLWAPTAQHVSLNLYADSAPNTEPTLVEMTHDAATGTWSVTGTPDWYLSYYTFNVRVYVPTELAIVENVVTDPYSVGLAINSRLSLIVNLADPAFMPDGWASLQKPPLAAPEDITIYELHVRDFSAFDQSVPEDLRGTYLAFTQTESSGMQHLRALADAGMSHLHILPTFDIATINENRARWFEPDYAELAAMPPDGEGHQEAIDPIRDLDGFNWGYDPYHFMAPEGSYATNPDGAERILEYRQMVAAVNQAGLRFVQDVVFNHTNASGQESRSVLDRIVPGYYHRLNSTGQVERSTCCQNTATEHNMMRRLMIDTVILNALYYKVDGFRFDLMGHHMVSDMQEVRAALDSLTLEKDGVDGSSIYVYGEGWDFGEVQDNARGINATQFNLAGTGIGTFNDRLRDAVRGGSPFGGRTEQGLGNGAYVLPNGIDPINEQLARSLRFADLVRVGLAGNLRDFTFIGASGETVTGYDVDYNGSPAGYTLDPQENIVYVSKHDNETLFDNSAYRFPLGSAVDMTGSGLARIQIISKSFAMFSQGIPFFQAGDDLLRSKSMDRDSYNSGDWFNRIDWTYQINNFRVGMPPAGVNSGQYDLIRPVLANEALTPTPQDIQFSANLFREMLAIRYSTPLFRLQTAAEVQQRLAFENTGPEQIPGVIVMSLSDQVGDNLDPVHQMVVVIFNARPDDLAYQSDAFAGLGLTLHPVQQNSYDELVRGATFDSTTATFSVPAWTTAVFVLPE